MFNSVNEKNVKYIPMYNNKFMHLIGEKNNVNVTTEIYIKLKTADRLSITRGSISNERITKNTNSNLCINIVSLVYSSHASLNLSILSVYDNHKSHANRKNLTGLLNVKTLP